MPAHRLVAPANGMTRVCGDLSAVAWWDGMTPSDRSLRHVATSWRVTQTSRTFSPAQSSNASTTARSMVCTGPVNHFFADVIHHRARSSSTPSTMIGA